MSIEIHGFTLVAPGRLESFQRAAPRLEAGQVLVAVAGCGVCHTDIGFFSGQVPTRKEAPIVLGHEISGSVVATGSGVETLAGRRAIVCAVWPCGNCRHCLEGRPTACAHSVMPGNDVDGGFASHVVVPANQLCLVDGDLSVPVETAVGAARLALWELSVVADAVTTPLQAIRRARLAAGELAIVIGVGGVGAFAIQIAHSMKAVVVAIDIDPARIDLAATLGAALSVDGRSGPRSVKTALRDFAGNRGLPPDGWRVFEMSGTVAGQELAWSLLARGGSLSVVGYTPELASVRLSNLMALDAEVYGNWGCDPALYPKALRLVASGQVSLRRLVRRAPLAEAPRLLEAISRREIRERVVLVP